MQELFTLYHRIKSPWPEILYRSRLQQLPFPMQQSIQSYQLSEDRQRVLSGKLLLLKALILLQCIPDELHKMQFNEFGRPWLSKSFDFNITHSGELVAVTAARDIRVGIDIEEIQNTDFEDFRQTMSEAQWQQIKKDTDPLNMFYKFWAAKEAILKAMGTGFSFPPANIETDFNTSVVNERIWHLQELSISSQYAGFIATDKPFVQFTHTITEVEL